MTSNQRPRTKLETHDYALLAAFRFALRSFLHFSESAAKSSGLAAQHYQAMLVVRGCPEDLRVTINDLAQQLLIRQNSAVGLVDRLEKQGLMARESSPLDKRKVHLRLTTKGERLLERLAGVHQEELRRIGPQLRQLVQQITLATADTARATRSEAAEAIHRVRHVVSDGAAPRKGVAKAQTG